MKQILVGSNAFFKNIKEYQINDKDYLILVDDPKDFKIRKEIYLRGIDKFYYKKDTPVKMIQHAIESNDPMVVGKFLVKEVAEEIGLKPQDILPLKYLIDKVDKKHLYQIILFNSIIENNSFDLTNEQIIESFNVYQNARTENF